MKIHIKDLEYKGWPDDWPEPNYDYKYIDNSCDHHFVNVGFNHIKLACKYCDVEKI